MRSDFKYPSSSKCCDISACIWPCEGSPKAVLQASHGMDQDKSSFNHLAKSLNEQGIVVCSYDILGHGQSQVPTQNYANLSNANAYKYCIEDMKKMHDIVADDYPGIPYFMLAFSLSSFTMRCFMQKYSDLINGAIIMGAGNEDRANFTATKVIQNMFSTSEDKDNKYLSERKEVKTVVESYKNNNFNFLKWFQIDDMLKNKYLQSHLWKYILTIDSFYSFKAQFKDIDNKDLQNQIPKDLPLIFISGKNDVLGDYGRVTTEIFRDYKSLGIKDVKLKLYPNLFHTILESDKSELVISDIYDWIDNHI